MADRQAYAYGTKVPVGQSKSEIERILKRYGAGDFMYGSRADGSAMVAFEAHGRRIRFCVPAASGRTQADVDREERRLWRSLAMAIKSKLDIVRSGIATFEAEMLPYTMLGDGRTFSEWAEGQSGLDAAGMPPMLPRPLSRLD
jgi:hypothetical protein